jgi:hypothetical protein
LSRKIILLNLVLVALLASAGWLLRARWREARSHERAVLEQTVPPRGVFAPPPPVPVKPVAAADYFEVAQKMLFSKDRNPTVVVDIPKPAPAPPEPPIPPLPAFYGTISLFGDSVILLSAGTGRDAVQKSYRAGDNVGPFKLVSFDRDNITLEWRGKTVNSSLQKLVAKNEPPPQPSAAQAPSAPSPVTSLAPAAPPAVTSIGSSSAGAGTPTLGVDMGAGFRACAMGDTSPSGTILNGYRKVIAATLMGNSCHWEPAK